MGGGGGSKLRRGSGNVPLLPYCGRSLFVVPTLGWFLKKREIFLDLHRGISFPIITSQPAE